MQEFSIVVVFPEEMNVSSDYLTSLIRMALTDARVIVRYSVFELIEGMLKIEGLLLLESDRKINSEALISLIGKPAQNVTLAVS